MNGPIRRPLVEEIMRAEAAAERRGRLRERRSWVTFLVGVGLAAVVISLAGGWQP